MNRTHRIKAELVFGRLPVAGPSPCPNQALRECQQEQGWFDNHLAEMIPVVQNAPGSDCEPLARDGPEMRSRFPQMAHSCFASRPVW